MKKFLTLKHWQLFLLLVGLPMVLEFSVMAYTILSRNFQTIFLAFPILMIIFLVLFSGWFYSLGTNLFQRLPETARMSLTKFKIFLFVYVAYVLFIVALLAVILITVQLDGRPDAAVFAYIIPLHLFAMFCMVYCLYFNAKALKTVELQRPATFNDYAGEFFLLWCFPIGIWIIQPRINKLFEPAHESSH